MESGEISLAAVEGPFDLQSTVESGQSYLWNRTDGETYTDLAAYGGDAWYETVLPRTTALTEQPTVLRVRQRGGVDDGTLEWEAGGVPEQSTTPTDPADGERLLTHLLRLDDDLERIFELTTTEPLVNDAVERYRGLRLTRDPPFACLVSFICSAQMRVARIFGMQQSLREAYGEPVTVDGRTLHAFPTPDALAERSEEDLRELGLGYRAPYVQRTAEMVASGDAHPAAASGLPYEDAREYLTKFVGVGDKVADCVLLFSIGYLQAIPLDTWIQTVISDYFPDCDCGNYAATSQAIRERLGAGLPAGDDVFGESGPDAYAGYAQTYVFHHMRTQEEN